MASPIPPAVRLTAALVLLLAMGGSQPSPAQAPSPPASNHSKEALPITDDEIEQRTRFLALGANIGAVESTRSALLLEVRRKAERELVDERLKLRSAKELGIEISDEEVKTLLRDIAARSKMTHEEFAQHLKGLGIDIATMAERLRARAAWREVFKQRYQGSSAE